MIDYGKLLFVVLWLAFLILFSGVISIGLRYSTEFILKRFGVEAESIYMFSLLVIVITIAGYLMYVTL